MQRNRVAQLWALAVMSVTVSTMHADIWLNETNLAGEIDFANVQWPWSVELDTGQMAVFYGRVYEANVTEADGANSSILAQLGYGPRSSDPRLVPWTWLDASYNVQIGSDDEYQALAGPAIPGLYSYTFRLSQDSGTSWTLADLDGAGANAGLVFDPAQTGVMTVVPEPAALAAVVVAGLAALRCRRMRSQRA